MPIHNDTKYYVSHNKVHADNDHSLKGKCARTIGRVLGPRHYNLDTVIKSLETSKLTESERNQLYKKFAKKFHLETEMETLIHIEKAKTEAFGKDSEHLINALAKEINSNPKKKDTLEKFVKQLPENSPKAQIIQDALSRAAIVTKWNRLKVDMGENFDPFDHYQDIKILVKSRLIYAIIGFQNTTQAGKENHKIVLNQQGLNIKIEGKWRPVSLLRDSAYFAWDESEQAFANANNQNEHWNYLSPFGLIPVDRFFHHEKK